MRQANASRADAPSNEPAGPYATPEIDHDTELVAGFYAAAAGTAEWDAAWSALCATFGATCGLFYSLSRAGAAPHIVAAHNLPFAAGPDGANGAGIIAPHPACLDRFTAPDLPPTNAMHLLGVTVALEGTALMGMTLHRTIECKRFNEADRRALAGLCRHAASAMRLEAALDNGRAAVGVIRASALDLNPHGVVICTATGSLVFANTAARTMTEAGLIALGFGRACLGGLSLAQSAKLEAMITSVASGRAGGCVRIDRSGLAPLAAIVEPLPIRMAPALSAAIPTPTRAGASRSAQALVLISLRDLGATTDAAPSHLMDLFGLTAAEAGIVPQLIAGDSAALIAQSRGVTGNTVKAQTARILAKTGAANLRALAAIIATIG
jgi:DNA-binding CsgD family transcriptional regulator